MKRLIDGLMGVKELNKLGAEIRGKEAELSVLKNEVETVKGELRGFRESLMQEVHQTRESSKNEIKNISAATINELQDLRKSYSNTVTEFSEQAQGKIQEMLDRMERLLSHINNESQRLAELRGRMEKYGEQARLGVLMMGILEDRGALRELPIENVHRIMERIHQWAQMNLMTHDTKPSKYVVKMENKFSDWREYRLTAITLWLKEEFERIAEVRYR